MKRLILAALLLPLLALGANTPFYVQTTATDGNLNSGSTTNDAAHFGVEGATWTSATRVLEVGAVDMSTVAVGDFMSVYTNGAPRTHYVALVTATNETLNTITLSATADSGTPPADGTVNCRDGGAWIGPNTDHGMFPFGFVENTLMNASNWVPKIYFKAGVDYHVITGVTHSAAGPVVWEGYNTIPGDGSLTNTLAKITGDESTLPFIMLVISGTRHDFRYLEFATNGWNPTLTNTGDYMVQTTSGGTSPLFYRCKFSSSWRDGLRTGGNGPLMYECEGVACNRDAANGFAQFNTAVAATYVRCWAHHAIKVGDAGDPGFIFQASSGNRVVYDGCISSFNGGQGFWNSTSASISLLKNCVAYSNGLAGVEFSNISFTSQTLIENCAFILNGEAGIRYVNSTWGAHSINNAFYGNTDGDFTQGLAEMNLGTITLTGDPFTDGPGGDFSLNNTGGAGADLRNAGTGAFLSSGTTSYPDVGAAQHEDAGGSVAAPSYSFPFAQ